MEHFGERLDQLGVPVDVVFLGLFLFDLAGRGVHGSCLILRGRRGLSRRLLLSKSSDRREGSNSQNAQQKDGKKTNRNRTAALLQRVPPAAMGRTARTTRLANSPAEAWIDTRSVAASASTSALAWATF